MMMKLMPHVTLRYILTIFAFIVLPLHAAEEPVQRKIVLRPNENAHYVVTMRVSPAKEQKPDNKNAQAEIAVDSGVQEKQKKVIEVEITGQTARAVTRTNDAPAQEIYMFRDLFLRFDAQEKKVRPYKFDQYAPVEMRFTKSFPGIDWVEPKYFRERVNFRGSDCYYFVQDARTGEKKPRSEDDALSYDNRFAENKREAWFSVTTGLPIAFQDGPLEGSYQHQATPTKAVTLPTAYQDAVKYYYGVK